MARVRIVSIASRSSCSVSRVIAALRVRGTPGRDCAREGGTGSAARSAARRHRTPVPGVSSPAMPGLPTPRRLVATRRRRSVPSGPSIVVLGDLVVDVVLAPDRELERGTDVTGRVQLRQGGSAASTARWLGRLGARCSLVCAIGRDAPGRALVAAVSADRVEVRAVRIAGARTGRIGVLVEPGGGQRSFVTDRGAALRLRPEDVKPAWIEGAAALHLPAYSLLDQPLGDAGLAAARLAHAAGGLV